MLEEEKVEKYNDVYNICDENENENEIIQEIIHEPDIKKSKFNDFNVNELNGICKIIESMQKFNQVEVLRILSKDAKSVLNENKYGVHVNLTDLPHEIIKELKEYIKYVNTQELNLNELEKQKEDYKNIFFTKDNKDNSIKI